MYIKDESQEEWIINRNDIVQKRDANHRTIEKTMEKAYRNGWSQEKIDKKIGEKQLHLQSLNNTLKTMSTLENSENAYGLSHSDSDVGGLILSDDGSISIDYIEGDIGNFVHEVTHAGQIERGDLALSERGGAIYYDIYDEFQAYAAQYAYVKSSSSNGFLGLKSYNSINLYWLNNIKNAAGSFVYRNQIGIDCGLIPVSAGSNEFTLLTAYPCNRKLRSLLLDFITL